MSRVVGRVLTARCDLCPQELADISLDQPHAPDMFSALVAAAKSNQWLPADWDGHDANATGEPSPPEATA